MTANYLNTLEIAGMREAVQFVILDMTCDLQRNTPGAEDTHGQPTPGTWANVLSDTRCHYWEQDEEELAGQPNATLTRERVVLLANTDVTVGDRITNVVGIDGTEIVGYNLDIVEVLKRPFDVLLIVRSIR